MAVVTIKAEGRPGSNRDKLLRQVRTKASTLLEGDADRVLVVYGPQGDASLYYEPVKDPSSTKSP
jgi:3-deoxy-D-arabino-heptulosonate 7-phosphate (DAHP) synthase